MLPPSVCYLSAHSPLIPASIWMDLETESSREQATSHMEEITPSMDAITMLKEIRITSREIQTRPMETKMISMVTKTKWREKAIA